MASEPSGRRRGSGISGTDGRIGSGEPALPDPHKSGAEHSCAIGTVQTLGVPAGKVASALWDKWRIIATPIVHAEYEGLRVTPNVYTTVEEIDTFTDAMVKIEEG